MVFHSPVVLCSVHCFPVEEHEAYDGPIIQNTPRMYIQEGPVRIMEVSGDRTEPCRTVHTGLLLHPTGFQARTHSTWPISLPVQWHAHHSKTDQVKVHVHTCTCALWPTCTFTCIYMCTLIYMCCACNVMSSCLRCYRAQHRQFRRKQQIRLSEMWVRDGEKSVSNRQQCSFIIGWPFTNLIAVFR